MDKPVDELILKAQEAVKASIVNAVNEYDRTYKQELQNELNDILIKVAEFGEKVGLKTPDLAYLYDNCGESALKCPETVKNVENSMITTSNTNNSYSSDGYSVSNNNIKANYTMSTIGHIDDDNHNVMNKDDSNMTTPVLEPIDPDVEVNMSEYSQKSGLEPIGEVNYPRPIDAPTMLNMHENSVNLRKMADFCRENNKKFVLADEQMTFTREIPSRGLYNYRVPNDNYVDYDTIYKPIVIAVSRAGYPVLATNPRAMLASFARGYFITEKYDNPSNYPLGDEHRRSLPRYNGAIVGEEDSPRYYDTETRSYKYSYTGKPMKASKDSEFMINKGLFIHPGGHVGALNTENMSENTENTAKTSENADKTAILVDSANNTVDSTNISVNSDRTNDFATVVNVNGKNADNTTKMSENSSISVPETSTTTKTLEVSEPSNTSSETGASSNTGLFNKSLDEALWEHSSNNSSEQLDSVLSNNFKQNGGFMSGKELLEAENRVLEAQTAENNRSNTVNDNDSHVENSQNEDNFVNSANLVENNTAKPADIAENGENPAESAENSQNGVEKAEVVEAEAKTEVEKVPDYIAKHTHIHEDGKVYVSNMADAEHQSPTGIYLEPMFSEENEPAHSPSYENTYGNMCIPGKKPYEFKSTYDMRIEKEAKEREAYRNAFKDVFRRISKGQEFDAEKDYFKRYEHHYMANKLVEKEAYELLTKSAELVEKDPYYNSSLSINLSPDTIFNLIRYNQYFDGDHILTPSSENTILDELKHKNNLFVFLYVSIHDYIQSFEDSVVQKYENKDDLLAYRKSIVAAIKRRCQLITGGYDDIKLVHEYLIDMAIYQTKGDMTVEDKNTINTSDNALGAVIPTELYGVFYALSGILQKMLKFNKFFEKTGMNPAQMYNRFVAKHPDYAKKYENNIRELVGNSKK